MEPFLNLLPKNYWPKIKKYHNSINLPGRENFFVVIPVFGEEKFIEKTLRNFTLKQDFPKDKIAIILVFRSKGPKDRTQNIISQFIKDNPNRSIILLDEDNFPGTKCIGHARAIGFGLAILSCLKNKMSFDKVYFISADADTLAIDNKYLYKIEQAFNNPEIFVATCKNTFTNKAMRNRLVNLLKHVDDGFFKTQYNIVGALNGRSYAIRAKAYLDSGGIDYTRQFDDIAFGSKVLKIFTPENFLWFNSHVTTSERRYAKTIQEARSLMDTYQKGDYVLTSAEKGTAQNKNLKAFILQHLNEGFNVLIKYFSDQYSFSPENLQYLLAQFKKYRHYLNKNLKICKIQEIPSKKVGQIYLSHSKGELQNKNWWHQSIITDVDLKNENK